MSESESESESKSPEVRGPTFSQALLKANAAAEKYAPPPPDYEKMGKMAKHFQLPKKKKKKTRKKSGAVAAASATLSKISRSSPDGYSPDSSSSQV